MKIHSAAEMLALGEVIGKNLSRPAVLELVGDVGVGKTTFASGLARGLGVNREITSPSFTISKRYALPAGGELIHYDFYRLDDPGIMQSDLCESLDRPDSIIVVEWGNDVANLLPADKIRLDISRSDDDARAVQQQGLPSDLWKTCGKLVENSSKKVEKVSKSVENSSKTALFASSSAAQNLPDDPTCRLKSPKSPRINAKSTPVSLYLDTATDSCVLRINGHEYLRAGKYDLAEQIFGFIHEKLRENGADWTDIREITFFSGPGSFTGLRIGAALVNTLADQLGIPLFDHHGQQHQIILPEYGRAANISAPRK